MPNKQKTTSQKAFEINLDQAIYGTIAEIGAGQEVSRNFFMAGGAAGTIAKSISAYDMNVSDALYGREPSGRYVTESRLRKMLEKEYEAVVSQVSEHRPKDSLYFAYANTVAARSFSHPAAECHGWMGICLQTEPGGPVNRVILHFRLLDDERKEQQNVVGILGVNLIYSAFHLLSIPKLLIDSLLENIGNKRAEVDMIRIEGPDFEGIDNRWMALYLLQARLTRAVMFSARNTVIQPSEILYKKNILVQRSRYYPISKVTVDMIKSGMETFIKTFGLEKEDPQKTMLLPEMSLIPNQLGTPINTEHVLQRADIMSKLGYPLLVTTHLRFLRIRQYLNRYTHGKIGFVLGVHGVQTIFDDEYYKDLEGGIMGAFALLFDGNTKLFVYPQRIEGEILSAEVCPIPARNQYLYYYFLQNKMVEAIDGYDESVIDIWPEDVEKKIKKGHGDWEDLVPKEVAEEIIKHRMFGFGTEV